MIFLRNQCAVLGHSQADTTQRYAHLADDPLVQATESVSTKIAASMNSHSEDDNVVKLTNRLEG